MRRVHDADDVHDDVEDACQNYTLCVLYMMMLQMHVTMIMRPTLLPRPPCTPHVRDVHDDVHEMCTTTRSVFDSAAKTSNASA